MFAWKKESRRAKARELRKRIDNTEHMFHICIYGAIVTLIGGIILGACAATMLR